jgi:hypothetical protein
MRCETKRFETRCCAELPRMGDGVCESLELGVGRVKTQWSMTSSARRVGCVDVVCGVGEVGVAAGVCQC